MFHVHIYTNFDRPSLVAMIAPKCNVTMIRSERDNLRAHYDRDTLRRQCQIVWGSIESETMTSECDTGAVMYFDTCLLLRLIGPQCRDPGNMRAMASDENTRIWINIGCCWPLMAISAHCPASELVTSHTDNIRGLDVTMGLLTICL